MVGRVLSLALALVLLLPAQGSAVTVEDIVALSHAGLADTVLVAVIDADGTVFDLTPDQIVELRNAGVANAVIVKMLGTKRESRAERRHSDAPPPVVVIGERPPAPVPHVVTPYVVAVPVPVFPVFPVVPVVTLPAAAAAQPQPYRGFGRFINDGWVDGIGFGRFINNGWVEPRTLPR